MCYVCMQCTWCYEWKIKTIIQQNGKWKNVIDGCGRLVGGLPLNEVEGMWGKTFY